MTKREAKRLERSTQIVAERLAGFQEKEVAKRNRVSRRTVRGVMLHAKRSDPGAVRGQAEELRTHVLAEIDAILLRGLARLGAGEMDQLKPAELARVLADVARVRRDMASAAAPGDGQHPSERLAAEQPKLERETEAQWNARHGLGPQPDGVQ